MNPVRPLWRWLFGSPAPLFEYCHICHTYNVPLGTHLCFGPLTCETCDEEIIIENPPGTDRPNVFGHIPCPGRLK